MESFKINNPPPIQPPPTVDLLGLTADEVNLLAELVGAINDRITRGRWPNLSAYKLYDKLSAASTAIGKPPAIVVVFHITSC